MTAAPSRFPSLEEFLQLPETKPASEYIDGQIVQKPMPKSRHSRLQGKLVSAINAKAEAATIAYGFPELRCTYPAGSRSSVYGGRSIVPDIAVLLWSNIQFDDTGEPLDDVITAPDWTIEILSPQQSPNLTNNILHCLRHGGQLGWLIDPDDRSVLILRPKQEPEFCGDSDRLPVLPQIPLELTASQLFDWLKMANGY